ncbi:MAG: hypothetical protein ACKV2U_06530 [Bryobacteraceae bacterium]
MSALLVLFAALLQAAPVVPVAVSVRLSSAIVSVRSELEHQRQLRNRPKTAYPRQAPVNPPQDPPPPFTGFAASHFQRPPPSFS